MVFVGTALAGGDASIATAPTLPYAQVVVGGFDVDGKSESFRLEAAAGDDIGADIRAINTGNGGTVEALLYPPEVTDETLSSSRPSAQISTTTTDSDLERNVHRRLDAVPRARRGVMRGDCGRRRSAEPVGACGGDAFECGNLRTLYRNGTSVGTSTLAPLAPTGSASVSPGPSFFNGRVDEVALYTRQLSGTQIQAHVQRTSQTTSKTTRYLYDDTSGAFLFEASGTGAIALTPVDGPPGDLARFTGPPTTATTVNYVYYNGHGDLAAIANGSGVRQAAYIYDPFGAATASSLPANATTERWLGRHDKQLDASSQLIEMGVRQRTTRRSGASSPSTRSKAAR